MADHDTAYYKNYFSPEAVERYKKIFPKLYGPDGPWGENTKRKERQKIKKSERETIYRHILATPLVEVLSVKIGSLLDDDDDERPKICEIYGKIRILDARLTDDTEIFNLFQKSEDNPQSVHLDEDEPLLLSPSLRNAVIVPSENTVLDVLLYDRKAHNKVVAQGRLSLDKIGDEFEEDQTRKVFGEDKRSFADVHYTAFQYAVAATVDVLILDGSQLSSENTVSSVNADDDDDDYGEYAEESSDELDLSPYNGTDCGDSRRSFVAEVFGSVDVRSNVKYGNSKGYPSISLFNKSPKKGVQVTSDGLIPLSRSTVVVPAYASSLVIEVNLSDHNTEKPIASGMLEFKPRDEDTFKKDLVGEHGRVRVRVTWNHAYDQSLFQASEKKHDRQKPEDIEDDSDPCRVPEVFSAVVYSKDLKPFSLYGIIHVQEMRIFRIFSINESWPQVCANGSEQVTIRGPRYSHDISKLDNFQIRVDLKDATTGGQISNGYASWDTRLMRRWLDKRVCSVMRGERGFSVVHYAFLDAISVGVDVKVISKYLQGRVCGKIVARYETWDYSTSYVNKYYQIKLFEKDINDDSSQRQQVHLGLSHLRLLKPVVRLPRTSSLIIEVRLMLYPELMNGELHLEHDKYGLLCTNDELQLKPGEFGVLRGQSGNWSIVVHLKPT